LIKKEEIPMHVEECSIVENPEGYMVNSCTGEVLDFENYMYQDYSNLEYYERASKKGGGKVADMKKIVLNYLQSIMTEEEKDMFYKILEKVGEDKLDTAYYLAIYEYILAKENKIVDRNYLKFLKMKGVGRYAIRQKKKLLRRIIKEDPVVHYINSLSPEKREEALKVYEILKEKDLIHGRAETRKKILLEYLNEEKKRGLLEEHYVKELIRWNFNYVTIL